MIITDYHRLRLARARGSDAGARAQTRQNQNARALFVTGCKYDCLTGNFNRLKSRLTYMVVRIVAVRH